MNNGIYQRSGMKGAQALVARPAPLFGGSQPSLEVELHENRPEAPAAPESVKPADKQLN